MTSKQQCLDGVFFASITKEEKEINAQKDFANLSKRLEKDV